MSDPLFGLTAIENKLSESSGKGCWRPPLRWKNCTTARSELGIYLRLLGFDFRIAFADIRLDYSAPFSWSVSGVVPTFSEEIKA